MPLHRVRCVGMSDEDMQLTANLLGRHPMFERTGLNATGLAEDEDIRALENQGVLVEHIPEEQIPIGWLEPSNAPPLPRSMNAATSDPDSHYSGLARRGLQRFVIQFIAPLTQADQETLLSLGVKVGEYVPHFAYKAPLTPQQVEAVSSLPFVRRVVPFDASLTLRRMEPMSQPEKLVREAGMMAAYEPEDRQAMYHVRCHDAEDIPAVAEALSNDPRIQRIEEGRNRIRIWMREGADRKKLISELANLPQVSVVEPFKFPHPLCSFARKALHIELPGEPPLPWHGEGQLVGVADSGVDMDHPDLKARVKKLIELVPPECPNDPFGHGTHVCSIIAGDGTASAGEIQGIAPGAQLVVQSVRDKDGNYSGIPVDLGQMFKQAYDAGVRIHNDSWGFRGAGLYTTDAFELDQFIFEHPDFLIVLAAGNEGQQPNPLDPSDQLGNIGYSSIASPGTSKNAITVGACCSPRQDGPWEGMTWRDYKGTLPSPQFPLVADEPICGDPEILAAFSSRGPTDDTRVKPDLVVPGTAILAAKSSSSSPPFHLEEQDFGGHYTYQSGTSMAAPVLAGAAAIVRQYYVNELSHERPSAALLKATLINGTDWINSTTAQDANVGQPNFHQGFGRLNMKHTLPIPGNLEGFSLKFVDVNRNDPRALNSAVPNQSAWKKRIRVKAGLPLRITLCWTDYPAHGLQNHLDLMVLSPQSIRLVGNSKLKRDPWAKTDRYNNVERIIVDNPAEGVWTVIVNTSVTPFPLQGFSMVVTGKEVTDFL